MAASNVNPISAAAPTVATYLNNALKRQVLLLQDYAVLSANAGAGVFTPPR